MNSLFPAIITGAVAIIIFALNHIITFLTNRNSKKKSKLENKLKGLYSPLYLQVRVLAVNDFRNSIEKIFIDSQIPGFSLNEINKLLTDNAVYASNDLIEQWIELVLHFGLDGTGHNFAVTVVKEYNEMRKKLGLEYDKIELATGYPKESFPYLAYKANQVS